MGKNQKIRSCGKEKSMKCNQNSSQRSCEKTFEKFQEHNKLRIPFFLGRKQSYGSSSRTWRHSKLMSTITKTTQYSQNTQILKLDLESWKIKIKNILRKMSYREKLSNIEGLIQEAHELSQIYGYFFITCAIITFNSKLQNKLSLWIHPNPNKKKCIHPIINKCKKEAQIQFYASLKNTLYQLFPTISLGKGNNYQQIISIIQQQKKSIRRRLKTYQQNKVEFHKVILQGDIQRLAKKNQQDLKCLKISLLQNFYDQNAVIYEEEDENQNAPELQAYGFKKQPISPCTTQAQTLYSKFSQSQFIDEQFENLFDDFQQTTLYGDEQTLDSNKNEILKAVTQEFINILF